MDVYLNDHLAGAMLGSDLVQQIRDHNENTHLGYRLTSLASQIAEDRQTLIELMMRMGISRNPAKRAGAWVAEKASRVKFGGLSSGEPDLGTFMAIESLALGVRDKLSLWMALQHVAGEHPAIASLDLKELMDRARAQFDLLEQERRTAGARALSHIHTEVRPA
jgi:hypothetical protein